jgi:hypothetical protein
MLDHKLLTSLVARHATATPTTKPPVFPLPVLEDLPPSVLVLDKPALSVHLAYERCPAVVGPLVPAASRDSIAYCIPRPTLVYAASDGLVIEESEDSSGGKRVVVAHKNGWLSLYAGLERVFAHPRDDPQLATITAGDPLGYLAPTGENPLRPLRFELTRAAKHEQVDPIRYMRHWRLLRWRDKAPSRMKSASAA